MDNDRTIGRTNVRSGGGGGGSQSSAGDGAHNNKDTPKENPLASESSASAPPRRRPPAASAPPNTAAVTSPGGAFQWPTSSEYYTLSNRIGQGAFASVWRATIRNTTKKQQQDAEKQQVECAIKIMDLEHVNINISGEYDVLF